MKRVYHVALPDRKVVSPFRLIIISVNGKSISYSNDRIDPRRAVTGTNWMLVGPPADRLSVDGTRNLKRDFRGKSLRSLTINSITYCDAAINSIGTDKRRGALVAYFLLLHSGCSYLMFIRFHSLYSRCRYSIHYTPTIRREIVMRPLK